MRWLALALCMGCSSEWVPAGYVLREGRNNDLAATQKYASKDLKLTGVVVATGEKKIEHVAGRTDGRWVESPSAEADAPHAFVQLRDPERPSSDVVTCYFDGGARASALVGDTVRVHGFFVEYVATAGRVEAVLNRCSLE